MIKTALIVSVLTLTSVAFAKVNLKDAAVKVVPGAKLVKEDGNDFDFETPKNSVVEVELNSDGTVDEASGDMATAGDIFNPGNNHLTLDAAVAALQKAGKTPSGDWSYEKSLLHGWIYEFEGAENGVKKEYVISATDGKLLKDKKDR